MSQFDIANYVVAAYRSHFDLDETAVQVLHEEDVEPVWTCFTDSLTFSYRLRAYTVIQTVKLFLKPGQSPTRELLIDDHGKSRFEITVYRGELLPEGDESFDKLHFLGSNTAPDGSSRVDLVTIRSMRRALEIVKSILDRPDQGPNDEQIPKPRSPRRLRIPA